MVFYEKLEELSNLSGKSINRIERELGYPRNALHNYKYNIIPSGVRLLEIAQYFKVSPEYLIGANEANEVNRPQSVSQVFYELNSEQKLAMTDICFKWLTSKKS